VKTWEGVTLQSVNRGSVSGRPDKTKRLSINTCMGGKEGQVQKARRGGGGRVDYPVKQGAKKRGLCNV